MKVVWSRTYGGPNPDHLFGMDLNDNGSIFVTGHSLSGTINWDTYTVKIDLDGNVDWERKIGNPRGMTKVLSTTRLGESRQLLMAEQ